MLRRRSAGPGADEQALGEIRVALAELQERVARVEAHQARFQESIVAQMGRLDHSGEDLTTALEILRARIAELEAAQSR